jgi:hypothetical protein
VIGGSKLECAVELTSGRESKEVAGGVAVTEVTVLLGAGLELGLDAAPNDALEVVVVNAGGLADNTAKGDGVMEAVVVAEGVSETVD